MGKYFLLFLFIVPLNANTQGFDTAFAKSNMIKSADSLVSAFKAGNWESYTLYTNPALVGSLGGKQEFIKKIVESFSVIPKGAWKKYQTGKVLQVLKTPNDLQGIIEIHSVIEVDKVRIISVQHLIAQSWDGGLFWTFFDSQNDFATSAMIKQDLSDQLIIPKRDEKIEKLKD